MSVIMFGYGVARLLETQAIKYTAKKLERGYWAFPRHFNVS